MTLMLQMKFLLTWKWVDVMTQRIKQNDKGTKLTFNVKDNQDLSLNLTNSTITCTISGGDIYKKITKSCTIKDAEEGICYCVLTSSDTDTPGSYAAEVKVDFGITSFTTVDEIRLKLLSVL